MQKIRKNKWLGENIRSLRIGANLTQEQVTVKLQLEGCVISRSIYSQIEGGSYNVRVEELVALRKIFGAEYSDFFEGMEGPTGTKDAH